MLKVEGLKVLGLDPVEFELGKGDCLVVRGPSGSGKSLLLRAIADLDPAEGKVSYDGHDRMSMGACAWRRLVRYQAAESGWWSERVADHFINVETARVMALKLGLPGDLFVRTVARLSSGERQRLAFIRAIEDRPPVLLLDEPTSALDEDSEDAMEKQFRKLLSEGTTIVLVTHKNAQDERFASHRLSLEFGRARFEAK